MRTKEFEVVEIGVEEGVDPGSRTIDFVLPNVMLLGGTLFIFQCFVSGQHH